MESIRGSPLQVARVSLVCLSISLAPALSHALQENAGVTAAPVLQIPLGARAVGMGSAFTAVADDVYALHYNPAGLATFKHREASFMYLKGLDDQNVEFMAAGMPLPFKGVMNKGYANLGGFLLLSQNGSIQVNRTYADGSLQDSRTISAGGDLAVGLSYAEQVAETYIEYPTSMFHLQHFAGCSGKFIRSTLADQYSAVAGAADLGYLVRSSELGWRAGLSILNFGTKMTFVNEGDPLPLTFRAGAAYEMRRLRDHPVTFALDGDYLQYERQWHVNLGAEYIAMQQYALRLGYRFHQDIAGLSVGFGFKWQDFGVDYAWAMSSAINDTHRFNFNYRFDALFTRERESPQRSAVETLFGKEASPGIEKGKPSVDHFAPAHSSPREPQGDPVWIY